MEYPAAPRGFSTDTFQSAQHGTVELPNPYAWLEDTGSPVYNEYVTAQNSHSESFIRDPSSAADLKSLESLLNKLHSLPSLASPPYLCGDHYYYRVAGQGQVFPIWYRVPKEYVDGTGGRETVNLTKQRKLFHDEAIELGAIISSGFSTGEKYWAYSSSIHGSEWCRIHVRSIVTGEKLKDTVIDTKFTGKPAQISWLGDLGFFYQYWPDKESGLKPQLRFHRVGENQARDVIVYEAKDEPTRTFCTRTDGEWVILFVLKSGRNSMVKVGRVTKSFLSGESREMGLEFNITVASDFASEWEYAGSTLTDLYFHSTKNNGEATALNTTSMELKAIIPGESERTLKMVKVLKNGNLATVHSINVHDEISIYSPAGQFITPIKTSILTVLAIEPTTTTFSILESTFSSPPTLHLATFAHTAIRLTMFPATPSLPTSFVTNQHFYASLDSTPIPMFLTHSTSSPITNKTPVLLYIYGGFGISVIPHFRPDFLAFMLAFRGVLAIANVRGGGEKGAAWYAAATKLKRQVLFNDVIAGVRYIKSFLGTENVILFGESMGGLNVCSVMIQQPDLVKGVISNVGALDILRRKRLGLRDLGGDDIGNADVPEEFDSMNRWAPLDNVVRGERYPAVLLSTGLQDDIVPSLHSVKMAAALQWASEGLIEGEKKGKDVSLIVVGEGSGHGINNSAEVKAKASLMRWGWVKRALGWEMVFDK